MPRVGPVTQFALAGLAALVLVGVGSAALFRRVGTDEAVGDARRVTEVIGSGIVEPSLSDGLLTGDPRAIAKLDRVIRQRVLRQPVVRVKLWTPEGRIVYSDEPRLMGSVHPLDASERRALATGRAAADVSDLSDPESRFERGGGKLLEVYVPVRTPAGQPLLFEAYQQFSSVAASGRRIWLSFAPLLLLALALLALVQLPLARSLVRRLRESQEASDRLLLQAVQASDVERRRIAADLHDSVVQDLAGISLSLGAAAERTEALGLGQLAAALRAAAANTRQSMRYLRSLLVDIYPPTLRAEGLEAALSDLLQPLSAQGVEAELAVSPGLHLAGATEQVVFRCAREAVRNAASHAEPRRVSITLAEDPSRAVVTLTVEDDGQGFSPAAVERRQENGHLGMALLRDAAAEIGGSLDVRSWPGEGTRVVLEAPAA